MPTEDPYLDIPHPTDDDWQANGHGPAPVETDAEIIMHPAVHVDPATLLGSCLEVYRRWLYLPDDDQVVAALGAVAANLLPGDPLWLLFVGAPGSGKTETIHPLTHLPYIHPAATITEAALLSGVAKKEQENGATGGLLRNVGDFGIILAKDFSGVLSMHHDGRASVLAALREVYDGSWHRPVGTGGGKVLAWTGKAGLVGAVTPSIDRHHAVMGALGERFVFYRLSIADPRAQARQRLANRGHELEMRAELADAVKAVLDNVARNTNPRPLDEAEVERLVTLSHFVVKARTAVERDGYDYDVVLVMPEAEAPGRLVGALGAFLSGLEALGAPRDVCWRIVTKAALDCVPEIRRHLLAALHDLPTATLGGDPAPARIGELIATTGIPKKTAERALEDLALLDLVCRAKEGEHSNAAWLWSLSEEAVYSWPD